MIISESTFAISAKNGLDKPKNQQNAIINGVAESAAKFILQKKLLEKKVHSFVSTNQFINEFRYILSNVDRMSSWFL